MKKIRKRKDNVGQQIAHSLQKPEVHEKYHVRDITSGSKKNHPKRLEDAIQAGKKEYNGQDFFIIVLAKCEKLLNNTLNYIYITGLACPLPSYGQLVYKYHTATDHAEEIWALPRKDMCQMYKRDAAIVKPEDYGTLKYVLDFYSGALDRKSDELNGKIVKQNITMTVGAYDY